MACSNKIKIDYQVENDERVKRKMSAISQATTGIHIKTEIDISETQIKYENQVTIQCDSKTVGASSEQAKCVASIKESLVPAKNNIYAGFNASVSANSLKKKSPLLMLVPMQEYLVDSVEVLKRNHTNIQKDMQTLDEENKKIANSQQEIAQLWKENAQLIRKLSTLCNVNVNKLLVIKIRTELMQMKREVMEMLKQNGKQTTESGNNYKTKSLISTTDRVKVLRACIKKKVNKCVLLQRQVQLLRKQKK